MKIIAMLPYNTWTTFIF